MEKNKGLTPHRKKLTKIPRKRYKVCKLHCLLILQAFIIKEGEFLSFNPGIDLDTFYQLKHDLLLRLPLYL
jgi:hypothetical protein